MSLENQRGEKFEEAFDMPLRRTAARENKTTNVVVPLEARSPLSKTLESENMHFHSEEHAVKIEHGDEIKRPNTVEARTAKPERKEMLLQVLGRNAIKNPWLPWRKPKTPEEQAEMEKRHKEVLAQTAVSAAVIFALDLFFIPGTMTLAKFGFALALLLSTLYIQGLKKKVFVSEQFEKNIFGKALFLWRKPKTPEGQERMQKEHKELLANVSTSALTLLFINTLFSFMSPERFVWALASLVMLRSFAPITKDPYPVEGKRVTSDEKSKKKTYFLSNIENVIYGRIPWPFRKPQTPEERAKSIQETKKMFLPPLVAGISMSLVHALGFVPLTPWIYIVPAMILIAPLIIKMLLVPLGKALAPHILKFMGRSKDTQKKTQPTGA